MNTKDAGRVGVGGGSASCTVMYVVQHTELDQVSFACVCACLLMFVGVCNTENLQTCIQEHLLGKGPVRVV